jgi:PAS domain S-box-containing protein
VKLRQRNAELERVETERKRGEEELRKYRMHLEIMIDERSSALRESEEKLRMFFENTSDGIVLTDEKGKFLLANKAAAKNLGYTREELLKLNITDIEAVESKEEFEKHYADSLKGKRLKFETIHRKKDGSLINVEVSLTLIRHGKINVLAYAVWRVITERKRAKEALWVMVPGWGWP